MDEVKYNYILESEGKLIGMFDNLDLATMFIETYYKKFYNEPELQIRITRNIEGSLD